jgi:hypothetical protein
MEHVRLSVRLGKSEPRKALFEGIPDHLMNLLYQCVDGTLERMPDVAIELIALHYELPLRSDGYKAAYQLHELMKLDADTYWDVVDALLRTPFGKADRLEAILKIGGSAYAVSEDKTRIERRVDEQTQGAFTRATTDADLVSEDLRQAWAHTYGRNPNPLYSWQHTITALEHLLIPIVVPKKAGASLGDVTGILKSTPDKWTYGMIPNGGSSEASILEGMLRLVWPNLGRHGGNPGDKPPEQHEAETALHVAIGIVNMCRGRLRKI